MTTHIEHSIGINLGGDNNYHDLKKRNAKNGIVAATVQVSTRASQKLLSDENLSALEAACEEGASALTEEERTRFTDLLRLALPVALRFGD
eukprot:5197306-Amphidinium_carterae.1